MKHHNVVKSGSINVFKPKMFFLPMLLVGLTVTQARSVTNSSTEHQAISGKINAEKIPSQGALNKKDSEDYWHKNFVKKRVTVSKGDVKTTDVFASRSWTLSSIPSVISKAEVSITPPFMYSYIGKKYESGQWEIYLMHGATVAIVREGSKIDGLYNIETVNPPFMKYKYLPTGIIETLNVGE